MNSQKTLIDIASVSQRVVSTLVRYAGRETVESFRLDKIVVGSGAVLETLNRTLLLNDGSIDGRLADWLGSDEPQACLDALNQMERILNRKPTHGGRNFFNRLSFTHTQDISDGAIRLFQIYKDVFHFLLMPTDVWNRENNTHRPQVATQHSPPRVEDATDHRDLIQISERKSGVTSGIPQEGYVKKQAVDAEKLKSILGWLNAWNSKETHRRTTLLRQPGTCAWLPITNAFETWRNTKDSFLWLHGKAGAGKSVLAASVIENLEDTLEDGENLMFFYCDFRTERSTGAAEVMRSLLSQLLQQFRWNTVDRGDLIDELAKGRDEDTSAISDVMLLAHYVSRVAEQFNQQPFIVIDALDECRDVEDLLDALKELTKGGLRLLVTSRPLQVIKDSLSELPSISMDTMKYEVSVDIELHVMRVLDSHRRLRIVDTSLKREIYSTLCKKADGMFRWVQCQLDILKRCMTAVRVREALNNLPGDLDATYERILLKINKDEEGDVVRRALEWLVAALAPLQLSQIMESLSIDLGRRVLDHESRPVHGPALLDALSSLVTYDELTDVLILSHFSVKEYLMAEPTRTKHLTYYINQQAAHTRLALLCICYIITYVKRSQHPGGYEASPRDMSRPRIWRDDYDTAVARTIGRPTVSFQSSVSHPLLEYVLDHGFDHLTHVDPRSQAILRAILDLRLHAEQHPFEWEQLCEKTHHSRIPWPSLKHDLVLYILISFAPEPMLRYYLGRAAPKLKDGTNPLIYAAHFSKIQHCRTLLSRGVSLNCSGWHPDYRSCQVLPLEVALECPNRSVVDLFLTTGSRVPRELIVNLLKHRGWFPACNVARLLQTDEFVEWAADIRDEGLLLHTLNPAHYIADYKYQPSEKDIDIIQRRLLQIGYDPSTRFDEKYLRIAVSAGHISTVKHILSLNISLPHDIILDASRSQTLSFPMISFLLGLGSDVHVISPGGNTPLHLIMNSNILAEDDLLEIVQVLVDAGCNPSTYNLAGETPLHLATMRGHTSIIKYLLSFQVELPPNVLLAAPRSNPASTIRFLRSRGAEVHVTAANGDTPLHLLLDHSNMTHPDECLEGVKVLISAGCNPFLANALGETPLDIAAKNASPMVVQYFLSLGILPSPGILLSVCGSRVWNMSPMIEFLVKKGVDIHSTCPNGDTPLHLPMYADSEVEHLRRLETLVNAGCNPRACNLAGGTPFHTAARRGRILIMEYLLSIGISAPVDAMLTLLRSGYLVGSCYPTARFLLDKGVDIHIVGEYDMTLLHFAAALFSEDDALAVVKLLVHAGCNPSLLDSEQETPLHIAARHGNLSVIDYLLSLDMVFPHDVLLAASSGRSPKTQVVRYLVDRGANTSVTTVDGDTPLHLLLAKGERMDCMESAEILIDAGCDPRARNLAGETPLHTAARHGFVTILKYLCSQGVPLPHDILRSSNPATICFLSGKGVDACSISVDDDTELMHRALDPEHFDSGEQDCLECARILVGLGWDPSQRNSSGETPIHVVTRHAHISVVKYLLSQTSVPLPADVLLVAVTGPKDGSWAVHRAVELSRFLICEGASVNTTAPNGDTPLHLALRCNFTPDSLDCYDQKESWKLVEILLNHGSDPAARNVDGQTPFDLAEARGHFFKENFLRLVRNSRVQHLRMSA